MICTDDCYAHIQGHKIRKLPNNQETNKLGNEPKNQHMVLLRTELQIILCPTHTLSIPFSFQHELGPSLEIKKRIGKSVYRDITLETPPPLHKQEVSLPLVAIFLSSKLYQEPYQIPHMQILYNIFPNIVNKWRIHFIFRVSFIFNCHPSDRYLATSKS